MAKVFVIEHSANNEFETPFTFTNVVACTSLDKANAYIDYIMDEVDDKTSEYFDSYEHGWLNPKLVHDVEGKGDNCRVVTYSWLDKDFNEKVFTHFKIKEVELV